jgi:hypothetical protein
METLRKRIGREEFDYLALMSALSGYANPRDKARSLMKKRVIVRIKKGLYVFGEEYRRRPYSRELLANLIYGPSLVSLESALSFHGLIPERVAAVTSVTPKRPKRFATPIGLFVYRQVPLSYYPLGMERIEEGNDVAFLIASPERALADKLRDHRSNPLRSLEDMAAYLMENLRIDASDLVGLDPDLLEEMAAAAGSAKIALCARFLRHLRTEYE